MATSALASRYFLNFRIVESLSCVLEAYSEPSRKSKIELFAKKLTAENH